MKRLGRIFVHWLPIAALTVGVCGLVYTSVQQNFRQSLNDPQIEIAEDAAEALLSGRQPAEIVPRYLIDVGKSLAPFVAVYDKNGNPLEASAVIDGAPPKPPFGVFEHARLNGENRVTWQPNADTRIALVVFAVQNKTGWFTASGRNMREVEVREGRLSVMSGLALVSMLLVTFALEVLGDFYRRRVK